jgi:hypothetical protein
MWGRGKDLTRVVCWEQKPGNGGTGETRVVAGVGILELGFNMEAWLTNWA